MILAFVFMGAALVLLCRLVFSLTIHAFPLGVAVCLGTMLHSMGMGMGVVILISVAAFVVSLMSVQLLLGARSTPTQIVIVLLFVCPALFAGYHLVHGLAAIAFSEEIVRQILGLIGGMTIGGAAYLRLVQMSQMTGI